MKYLLLLVGFVAGIIAATFLGLGAEQRPVSPVRLVEPAQVLERATPPDVAPIELLSAPGAALRTPVPTVDEEDLKHAIAEAEGTKSAYDALLQADGYDTLLRRMEEAEGEANVLLARIAHLERELALAKLDPTTPFGHFATLPEAEGIDTKTLSAAQSWLEQFPVILAPHEAEWLIERIKENDWKLWPGHGSTETLIVYLNPDRLVAELPAARVAELRAYYEEEGLFR